MFLMILYNTLDSIFTILYCFICTITFRPSPLNILALSQENSIVLLSNGNGVQKKHNDFLLFFNTIIIRKFYSANVYFLRISITPSSPSTGITIFIKSFSPSMIVENSFVFSENLITSSTITKALLLIIDLMSSQKR